MQLAIFPPEQALERTAWHVTQAAGLPDLSRHTRRYRMDNDHLKATAPAS